MLLFWGKLAITPKSRFYYGSPAPYMAPLAASEDFLVTVKDLSDYSASVSTPMSPIVRMHEALKTVLAFHPASSEAQCGKIAW